MRAWRLNDIGDIRLEDVPVPEPKAGEVLIKVKACGICGSDIPRIYDTGAHKMPLTPGHEFSGVVDGVGADVSQDLIGKHVAVYPKIACGKCYECAQGNFNMCSSYDYVGSRRDGAFAEYVTAPAVNLLELPDNVSFEEAAMMEPLGVAANAMRRLPDNDVPKTAPVAVCGAGTIGVMTIMLLKEAGYNNIYVIGNKTVQGERLAELGIAKERFCNSRTDNPVDWLKNGVEGGVKVYFECVGRNESITYALGSMGSSGLIILVGNPYSDMTFTRNDYWQILRNQLTLCGVWNSEFPDDWNYVLAKMNAGAVDTKSLITHRLGMDELESGFKLMRDKTEYYCKVMLVI